MSDTVHSFRGYAWGLTIIGLMNAVVVGLGAVVLVTTAGTLLFGVLGATLAAPVTAVALRTVNLLRGTGLFAQQTPASGRSNASA